MICLAFRGSLACCHLACAVVLSMCRQVVFCLSHPCFVSQQQLALEKAAVDWCPVCFATFTIGIACWIRQDIHRQNYSTRSCFDTAFGGSCARPEIYMQLVVSLQLLFPVALLSEPGHETEAGPAVMSTVLIGAFLHDCLPVICLSLCIPE